MYGQLFLAADKINPLNTAKQRQIGSEVKIKNSEKKDNLDRQTNKETNCFLIIETHTSQIKQKELKSVAIFFFLFFSFP